MKAPDTFPFFVTSFTGLIVKITGPGAEATPTDPRVGYSGVVVRPHQEPFTAFAEAVGHDQLGQEYNDWLLDKMELIEWKEE